MSQATNSESDGRMIVSGCQEGQRRGRRQGRAAKRVRRGRRTGIWLWLLVLGLALVAYGCGGDSEEAAAPPSGGDDAEAGYPESPPEPPAPKAKRPAPKQEKKETERVLPDNLADWIEEDYYAAKRKNDPRLLEAVANLAQSSAGADADTAAQILTTLLEKTEGAEPRAQPGMYPGGQPGSYPGDTGSYPGDMRSSPEEGMPGSYGTPSGGAPADGMPGSYPGSTPGSYPDMGPAPEPGSPGGSYPGSPSSTPGSADEYRSEGGDGDGAEDGYMRSEDDQGAGEEQDEYDGYMESDESDEERDDGYMGYPEGRRAGPRAKPRVFGASPKLIEAIVRALAANGSQTARQTLKEVVEGKFETDNDRVATFVSLETMVAKLTPEHEDLLFRCLTAPQNFRELGGAGSAARPTRSPYDQGYSADYGQGYRPGARTSQSGKLTAEELQQEAFALMGPVASEGFRVRLARHLANPQTVREDHDLFGDYIRERRLENIAAQMVLYTGPSVDSETKEVVEDNLLAMSSEALGGILGIPLDQLRAQAARRSRPRRGSPYGDESPREGYPGYPDYGSERGMPGDMRSAPPEGYEDYDQEQDRGDYEETRSVDDEEYGSRMGFAPGRPQATPGGPRSSGRRSRYDRPEPGAQTGRPSRYGQPEAGPLQPEMPGVQEPDPDEPYRLAEKLWGAELTGLLENRLNQAGSLDSSAQMILLASTMPVDSMRSKLHALLHAHWKEGPGSLEAAGLLDDVVVDPAFLALVKTLPRKEAPKAKSGATRPRRTLSDLGRRRRDNQGRGYPGRERPGQSRTPDRGGYDEGMRSQPFEGDEEERGPGMGRRPGAGPEDRAEPEDPAVAWMATSEDLLRVLCERFQAAARNRARPAAAASQGEGTQGLPFEVHQDAWVVAEYHLDWPGDDQQKLSGVPLGAMKLHFVRAEQQARPTTAVGFYRRKLGSPDIREVEDGTWLEDFRAAPEAGWKRSIDVMITTTGPAIEKSERAEVPITVDILCIDIKDPAPAGAEG